MGVLLFLLFLFRLHIPAVLPLILYGLLPLWPGVNAEGTFSFKSKAFSMTIPSFYPLAIEKKNNNNKCHIVLTAEKELIQKRREVILEFDHGQEERKSERLEFKNIQKYLLA